MFERYRLLRFLGEPPPHTVLLTRDASTDAPMVLHLLPEALGARRPEGLDRLVETLEMLRDDPVPGVPTVGSFDLEGSTPGWVEEFAPGEALGAIIARSRTAGRRLPFGVVVTLLRRVAAVLAEAHKYDLFHGDLTPRRILVDRRRVALLGFPWSPLRPVPADEAPEETLAWLPPEFFDGGRPSAAWDIYQLGLVAYEMVTGVRPFPETPGLEGARRRTTEAVPPPASRRSYVPVPLQKLIMLMLDRAPTGRPGSARKLLGALTQLDELLKSGKVDYILPSGVTAKEAPPEDSDGRSDALDLLVAPSAEDASDRLRPSSPPPADAPPPLAEAAPVAVVRLGRWALVDLELVLALALLVVAALLLLTARPRIMEGPPLVVLETEGRSHQREAAP